MGDSNLTAIQWNTTSLRYLGLSVCH